MRSLSTWLAASLAAQASAQSLGQRFGLSSTCDDKDTDGILKEAINMADNAIKMIDPMLQGGFSLKKVPQSVFIAAETAFGVPQPKFFTFNLAQEDKDRLTAVQSNFQAVKDALASGNGMGTTDNFFHCDSTALSWSEKVKDIWVKTQFPGVQDDTTIKDFFSSAGSTSPPNGLWKDPDHKDSRGDFNFINDEYDGDTMCGDHASEAITYTAGQTKNMFICPKGWDTANYQASLADMKDSTDDVTWKQVRSTPGILLHEMLHWISADPHITDEVINVGGGNQKAYGLIACWVLAGNSGAGDKSKTVTNADSYHVFATMAYLSKATFIGE